MITGREALATVEQAIGRARNQESRLETALRSATEEAVRLRAERMEAFRELARLKLEEGLIGEIEEAERRSLALLEEARRKFEALSGERAQAQRAVEAAEGKRHASAAAYEEAVKALHALRSRVEAETLVSPAWAAQRASIDELKRIAEKAEAKAQQAEGDREAKRKPYDADPLFRYLWERRYGTAHYSAGALTRFADSRVARLIGYDKARANYALLNEIPLRLREHVDQVRLDVAGEEEKLKEIERAALVSAGFGPLEERASQTKATFDTATKELEAASTALAALDRERDGAFLEESSPYKHAIELLARADAAQDLRTLYAEASRTASPKDEAVLKAIEASETAIGRAEAEIGIIRREMRELAFRRSQIEKERDDFRRRGRDNPYGTFGNEQVLSNVLGGILGGLIQATVLRDVLNKGYRPQSGPWDSDFGGREVHFPPSSAGDRGDGFTTGGSF
jgi:hypothetical protein